MLLTIAARRRLMFVGGKGGVGKTSVASAIAFARASEGAQVLLISTDPAHNLGHLWERRVGDTTTALVESPGRLDGIEIDPERTVTRHLDEVRGTMLRLLPKGMHPQAERHLALARDAPGTHESAVLDRLSQVVVDGLANYDLVVVDTAPTGHTLRLLALPEQMTAWTETLLANRDRAERFGAAVHGLGGGKSTTASADRDAELRRVLVRRQMRYAEMRNLVCDHQQTAFVLVATAERLPVAESVELRDKLRELGVGVAAVVVNRRSPGDDGELLAARHRLETAHLHALRAGINDVPIVELPLLPDDMVGEQGMAVLADALRVAHARSDHRST